MTVREYLSLCEKLRLRKVAIRNLNYPEVHIVWYENALSISQDIYKIYQNNKPLTKEECNSIKRDLSITLKNVKENYSNYNDGYEKGIGCAKKVLDEVCEDS